MQVEEARVLVFLTPLGIERVDVILGPDRQPALRRMLEVAIQIVREIEGMEAPEPTQAEFVDDQTGQCHWACGPFRLVLLLADEIMTNE